MTIAVDLGRKVTKQTKKQNYNFGMKKLRFCHYERNIDMILITKRY